MLKREKISKRKRECATEKYEKERQKLFLDLPQETACDIDDIFSYLLISHFHITFTHTGMKMKIWKILIAKIFSF